MNPPRRLDNDHLTDLADRAPDTLGADTSVGTLVSAALCCWRDDDPRADQTVTRMGEIAVRFARRLAATGVERAGDISAADCQAFIDAPTRTGDEPTLTTRHFRRTTLRALLRTGRQLGVLDADPTVDLELPPRTARAARPLTPDELHLCRTAAFNVRAVDLRRPAAWALAEAAAATAEIPSVRRGDLAPPLCPEVVALPGTRRLRARTVELTSWGAALLTRRLTELPDDPEVLVAYGGGAAARSVARHAAACTLITAVLDASGLSNEADVRPASVRHWRARDELDRGASIEEVANLLGHRSLDETAEACAHDWWNS